MKMLMVMMSLVVSMAVYGYEEFRTFTLGDTSFDAVVISCDTLEDTVELVTWEGSLVSAKKTMFTDQDQAFLTSWEMRATFESPSKFILIPTRWTDREWLGEPEDEDRDGTFELFAGETEYRYTLAMYNLGSVPLENLTVHYRIQYQQNPAAGEPVHYALHAEDEGGGASMICAVEGEIPVASLGVGQGREFATEPVVLSDIHSAISSSSIAIVVQMQTADGHILNRTIELSGSKSPAATPAVSVIAETAESGVSESDPIFIAANSSALMMP